jgi:hypothetical protein
LPVSRKFTKIRQAKKFGALADDDDDSELDEDNLLETPLDKLEPYIVFRDSLLSKS